MTTVAGTATEARRPRTGRLRFVGRRSFRLLLLAAVTAAITLPVVATSALFNSTTATQTARFASGTVTLTSNLAGACNVTNMLPGATPSPCTLTVTYSGSGPAYLGLDVLIETQAGNGGTKLYNPPDASHALQVTVTSTSPTVTYAVPTTATTCPTSAPAGSSCYELDSELVSTAAFTTTTGPITFTATASLPAATTTGYRGGAAQVILRAHAAQSAQNSVAGCIAGSICPSAHWN